LLKKKNKLWMPIALAAYWQAFNGGVETNKTQTINSFCLGLVFFNFYSKNLE